MKISLKTRNTPKLLVVWTLNIMILLSFATEVVDVRNLETIGSLLMETANDPGMAWLYMGLLTLVSIFNGAFSRSVKECLVFWPAPRPGSRAFSYYMLRDSTIDKKLLLERFDPLPSDPEEQNALWARWLNELWTIRVLGLHMVFTCLLAIGLSLQ